MAIAALAGCSTNYRTHTHTQAFYTITSRQEIRELYTKVISAGVFQQFSHSNGVQSLRHGCVEIEDVWAVSFSYLNEKQNPFSGLYE